jgi:eukaryotic-like serine/threonine-protein kinase
VPRPRRRHPFRRPPAPPPPDPRVYERLEYVEEGPVRRFDNPWIWLALLGVGLLAAVLVLVAVLAARDDEPRRQRATAVTVPLAVGADHATAAAALEELGLVPDTFPVPSEQPAGRVLEQMPAAGTREERGQVIRLDVSLGADPLASAPVPDVTGSPAASARAEVRAAGFTHRTVARDAPSRDEVGEVLLQEPAAGTPAPGLTQITLFVGE